MLQQHALNQTHGHIVAACLIVRLHQPRQGMQSGTPWAATDTPADPQSPCATPHPPTAGQTPAAVVPAALGSASERIGQLTRCRAGRPSHPRASGRSQGGPASTPQTPLGSARTRLRVAGRPADLMHMHASSAAWVSRGGGRGCEPHVPAERFHGAPGTAYPAGARRVW